jgi:hypothetical protein
VAVIGERFKMPTLINRAPSPGVTVGDQVLQSQKLPPETQSLQTQLRKMFADNDGAEEPVEVNLINMCNMTGVMYNRVEVLTSRQYTTGNIRVSRFRLWIAKGPSQFNKFFKLHHAEFDDSYDFNKFLIQRFYNPIFFTEEEDLAKLSYDNDMWHIVLVGFQHNCENEDD